MSMMYLICSVFRTSRDLTTVVICTGRERQKIKFIHISQILEHHKVLFKNVIPS